MFSPSAKMHLKLGLEKFTYAGMWKLFHYAFLKLSLLHFHRHALRNKFRKKPLNRIEKNSNMKK